MEEDRFLSKKAQPPVAPSAAHRYAPAIPQPNHQRTPEKMKTQIRPFSSTACRVASLLVMAVALHPEFARCSVSIPAFSPDGKEVLFPVVLAPVEPDEKVELRAEDYGLRVLLYNLSNKTTKVIFQTADLGAVYATWGTDGREVLVASTDMEGSEPMKVTILQAGRFAATRKLEVKGSKAMLQGLAVAPPPVMGRSMFFSGKGIVRLNLESGVSKAIRRAGPKSTSEDDETCSDFVFAAAGRLYYLSQSGSSEDDGAGEAEVGTLDQEKLTFLPLLNVEWSAELVPARSAAVSRDGSRIAVLGSLGPDTTISIYRMAPPGPVALTPGDIKHVQSLVTQLKQHTNGVSQFLWERLSDPTRNLLAGYTGKASEDNAVQEALVRELNLLLKGDCIHGPQFSGVGLSRATQRRLDKPAEAIQGTNLVLLNRMLLEDAFPAEIANHRPLERTLQVTGLERTFQGSRRTVGSLLNLQWSPDGKTLYAAAVLGNKMEDEGFEFLLGELPVSGSKPRWTSICQVSVKEKENLMGGWASLFPRIVLSSDGRTIAACIGGICDPAKNADRTLFLVALGGDKPKVTSIRVPGSSSKPVPK